MPYINEAMAARIGNTVQCGVYMINGGGVTYPIPFSGNYDWVLVPNDCDDHYLIYPGFRVVVWKDINCTGTMLGDWVCFSAKRPVMVTPSQVNQASSFQIWYMNDYIETGTYTPCW